MNLEEIKIPIFGVASVAAGFYVGYNESKGILMSSELENILKYGPIVFATITSPIINKLNNMYLKYLVNRLSQVEEQTEVTMAGETKRKYEDLGKEEKLEVTLKTTDTIKSLESKLENSQYLKPTINAFAFTAIESMAGYALGRVVGYSG